MKDSMTPYCSMCHHYLDSDGKPAGEAKDGDRIGFLTTCDECMNNLGFSRDDGIYIQPAWINPDTAGQPVYRAATDDAPENLEQ